jgi:hypothetical protein
MSDIDKRNLTAAFILEKQNKVWMHGVKPPERMREQRAYTPMNKFVKDLSTYVEQYLKNKEKALFGTAPYHFVQQLYNEAVYGSTTTLQDNGKVEYIWTRRLAPIISHHVGQAQISEAFAFGSLRGPSHPDWILRKNESLLNAYFEVKEAGDPFTQSNGRKMLTLFAKIDGNMKIPMEFFYTGILCTTMRHQHGRFERVAVGIPLETSLWIIPPSDFSIDNVGFVHAAHLLHQEQNVAHFEFYDYGDHCIFLRQIRAFKAGERLFCFYAADYDFHGEQFIKLDPPPAPVGEEEGDNKRNRKGKAKKTVVGGGSEKGKAKAKAKAKAKGGGRAKSKGKKGGKDASAGDDDMHQESMFSQNLNKFASNLLPTFSSPLTSAW